MMQEHNKKGCMKLYVENKLENKIVADKQRRRSSLLKNAKNAIVFTAISAAMYFGINIGVSAPEVYAQNLIQNHAQTYTQNHAQNQVQRPSHSYSRVVCSTCSAENESALVECSYYANTPAENADESLEQILAKSGRVKVDGIFAYNGKNYKTGLRGTGTLLRGGYILTADHVAVLDSLYIELIPGFYQKAEGAVKQSQTASIELNGKKYELDLVVGDSALDYHVLKIKNCPEELKKEGIVIGDSFHLKVGNIVYICGNGADSGLDVRLGIISKQEHNAGNGWGLKFGFSPLVIGGDSGGGVYALRNKQLELVSIIQLRESIFNYGTGINRVMDHLKTANQQVYDEIMQK